MIITGFLIAQAISYQSCEQVACPDPLYALRQDEAIAQALSPGGYSIPVESIPTLSACYSLLQRQVGDRAVYFNAIFGSYYSIADDVNFHLSMVKVYEEGLDFDIESKEYYCSMHGGELSLAIPNGYELNWIGDD